MIENIFGDEDVDIRNGYLGFSEATFILDIMAAVSTMDLNYKFWAS